MKINNLICFIFGHIWRYNFPSYPNRSICKRCKLKSKLNLKTFNWEIVPNFENNKRSDKELIDKWFQIK